MARSNTLILVMFFCIAALILLFSTTGYGQEISQKEKFNNTITDFFDLYNSGDTSAYRKFLEPISENETQLKQVLTGFNNAYRVIGKVDIKKVQLNSSQNAEVWVRDQHHDAWWKFSIYTDSFQHFRRRTIMPVPFEDYFIRSGKLNTNQLRDSVDQYITSRLSPDFAGNVLIAKGNELIYTKSFGNNCDNISNHFQQQFDLASMGKMFTAISILQLRDAGLLSLDDKVEKILPDLKNKKLAGITVQQLLTHTSGMGDFFESPLYEKLKDSLHIAKDYLPFIEADQPAFEPGKGWSYSNTGFCLLGLIVEKVTNSTIENYIQHNIFDRSFMSNSVAGSGAGGGKSTVNDLHKFSIALLKNVLLEKESTNELFTYTVNGKYGFGTEHQLLGDENIVGHSGGFINVCTELNLYIKSGYIVIILSDTNPPYGHFLSNKIKELLVRK